jgi:hypothetical protein
LEMPVRLGLYWFANKTSAMRYCWWIGRSAGRC